MSEIDLDAVRTAALRDAEKSERLGKYLLISAALFEAVTLAVVVVYMDWSDSTHVVVFLCACLVYAPLAFGLVSLRAWLEGSNQRILTALRYGSER